MKKSLTRSFLEMFLMLLITAGVGSVWAGQALQRGDQVTPAERALLPDYCNYTQSFGNEDPMHPSPAAKRYENILGKALWGMHHYCIGLVHIMRAERFSTPALQKRQHWQQVVNETNYVIRDALNHNQRDFVMFPEIFMNLGKALFELKQVAEAEEAMRKSIQAKPDYWPAYVTWADQLVALGRVADARAVLKEGLKHSPQSKVLLARAAELEKSAVTAKPDTRAE